MSAELGASAATRESRWSWATSPTSTTAHKPSLPLLARTAPTTRSSSFTAEAKRLIFRHADRLRTVRLSAYTAFLYLAYHNVHGATNDDAPLQAPSATVELYNRTVLDTYKLAGAMITKLDDGVGAVHQALEQTRMLPNTVQAFCSDNGGPLDHATSAPFKGGKHTLWDGGVRVTAWIYSALIPPVRRGSV